MSTLQSVQDTVKGAVDTLSGKPGFQQSDVKDLLGKVRRGFSSAVSSVHMRRPFSSPAVT
jgi:hypothetical protein